VCCDVIILVVCETGSTCVTNKWRKIWNFVEEVPYLQFHGTKSERRFSNYVFWAIARISDKFISTVLTFEGKGLTLCTTNFNIQKFCVLPTIHLCVLRRSQNKQQIFLYTAYLILFTTEAESVYCAVRTGSNSNRYTFVIKGLNWSNELSRSEILLLSLIQISFYKLINVTFSP
jgi:hypothetical protein